MKAKPFAPISISIGAKLKQVRIIRNKNVSSQKGKKRANK